MVIQAVSIYESPMTLKIKSTVHPTLNLIYFWTEERTLRSTFKKKKKYLPKLFWVANAQNQNSDSHFVAVFPATSYCLERLSAKAFSLKEHTRHHQTIFLSNEAE